MRQSYVFSVASAALVAGFTATHATAAPVTQRDSGSFVSTVDQIEGDVLPTALGDWSDVGSPFTSINGDGTFDMVTPDSAFPALQHNAANNDFSSSTGWTWETRFQINSANDSNRGVWEILIRDNDSGSLVSSRIHFLATGLDRDTAGFGVDPEIAFDFTDGFHTVRAAVDSNNLTSVWIDGNLVIDELVSANFNASEFSRIGRWGGQTRGGDATIDYIRFDTTGAYAPVPEPGSLALLGLGGLALLRRRR